MDSPAGSRNAILARLEPDDLEAIIGAGRTVTLNSGDFMHRWGEETTHYLFPLSGVVSLTVPTPKGHSVEVGLVGREGIVGISHLLGEGRGDLESMAQVAGVGFDVSTNAIDGKLLAALLAIANHYASGLLIEIAQTAACNGVHTVEQRTARWLLHAVDRAGTPDLKLTHEFLAMMLAVRRASVTGVGGKFPRAHLLRAERGTISIVNADGLRGLACTCYEVVRAAAPSCGPIS
jgi:CRP-like cAMP-binding protein